MAKTWKFDLVIARLAWEKNTKNKSKNAKLRWMSLSPKQIHILNQLYLNVTKGNTSVNILYTSQGQILYIICRCNIMKLNNQRQANNIRKVMNHENGW